MVDEDGPCLSSTERAAETASGFDKAQENAQFLVDVASMDEAQARKARKQRQNRRNEARRQAKIHGLFKANDSLQSQVQELREENLRAKVFAMHVGLELPLLPWEV